MRIIAHPPFDTILGTTELTFDTPSLTLWELLEKIARKYPSFRRQLPTEATDEALRQRLLPIGESHIYSVNDPIPTHATVNIFPPISGG